MGNNNLTKKFSARKLSLLASGVVFAGIIGTTGMVSASRNFSKKQPTRAQCQSIGFTKYSDCLQGNPSPSVCEKLGFKTRFECISDKPTREECTTMGYKTFSKCINKWRSDKQKMAHGYGNHTITTHLETGDDNNDDDNSQNNNNENSSTFQRIINRIRG